MLIQVLLVLEERMVQPLELLVLLYYHPLKTPKPLHFTVNVSDNVGVTGVTLTGATAVSNTATQYIFSKSLCFWILFIRFN